MTDTRKECTSCLEEKGLDEFPKRKKGKFGRDACCKECRNGKKREKNKERVQNSILSRREKYFTNFKNLVKENGGICLSTIKDYINAKSPLTVKCFDGHIWTINLNNLKSGKWCPTCRIHINEFITLEACKFLFGTSFRKVRPKWLNLMEIDVYSETLKFGCEYNGIQHYVFTKFYHKTREAFNKRVKNDKLKIKLCKKQNIKLLIIPYTVKTRDICKFIWTESKKLCMKPKRNYKKFNYNQIIKCNSLNNSIKDICI